MKSVIKNSLRVFRVVKNQRRKTSTKTRMATAKTTKTIVKTTPPAPSVAAAPSAPAPSPGKKAKKAKKAVDPLVKDIETRLRNLSRDGQIKVLEQLKAKDENMEVDAILAASDKLNSEERAALIASVSTKKRARAPKLEGQPSEGRSAYFFFQKEALPELKANNPNLDHGSAMKMMGKIWKEKMTAEEKAPFEEMSKAEKEKQKPLLEAFKAEHPDEFDASGKRIQSNIADEEEGEGETPIKSGKKRGKRTVKKVKDPNAPKRNMNAFMYFQQFARDQKKFMVEVEKNGKTVLQFDKAGCGAAWKALAAEKKAKFEALAAKDKQRYTEQMATYKAQKESGEEPTQAIADEEDVQEESSEVSSSSDEE